jgi:hypothetical protein
MGVAQSVRRIPYSFILGFLDRLKCMLLTKMRRKTHVVEKPSSFHYNCNAISLELLPSYCIRIYHNSGHYPLSCLSFETRRFGGWILSSSSVEPTQLDSIDRASLCLRTSAATPMRLIKPTEHKTNINPLYFTLQPVLKVTERKGTEVRKGLRPYHNSSYEADLHPINPQAENFQAVICLAQWDRCLDGQSKYKRRPYGS